MSSSAAIEQRNQEATVYVGNLDEKATEELLWELMLQVGVVVNVHIPRDKVTSKHSGFGFVEFRTEEDAEYATKVMNMIQLFNKIIKVKKASQDTKTLDIGANLFLGNLDPDVDEKLLYDTFSVFGGIIETPKVMRDVDTKQSKGFGFVAYDSFDAADLAIECMNGQYLCNRQIVVQYAYKKGSQSERHGSQAERLLASNNPSKIKPHTRFAFATPAVPAAPVPPVPMAPMYPTRAVTMVPPPPPMGMQAPPMYQQPSMYTMPPPPPPQHY
ncbi:splicing factor 3B subunit 4-like [Achlya hypogyna]|uniref:Splicing factor 3B subunit 4 n=1 Tax=Achlya hypogyna TaxID=1202772 RepID=A0A1V9ZUR5_ACHHY|nr:splicing factor 3B subunit 4-like [Achlya hypogyna]